MYSPFAFDTPPAAGPKGSVTVSSDTPPFSSLLHGRPIDGCPSMKLLNDTLSLRRRAKRTIRMAPHASSAAMTKIHQGNELSSSLSWSGVPSAAPVRCATVVGAGEVESQVLVDCALVRGISVTSVTTGLVVGLFVEAALTGESVVGVPVWTRPTIVGDDVGVVVTPTLTETCDGDVVAPACIGDFEGNAVALFLVGDFDCAAEGNFVGDAAAPFLVGDMDGDPEGVFAGDAVAPFLVGGLDGDTDGGFVGDAVAPFFVGDLDGDADGNFVGDPVARTLR